jgi:hypothetical protein
MHALPEELVVLDVDDVLPLGVEPPGPEELPPLPPLPL